MVERRLLWMYLLDKVPPSQTYRQYLPHIYPSYELTSQTKTQEITNNLVAGTVGGFAGTALNTPCQFPTRL
jgi:hypothetical protein